MYNFDFYSAKSIDDAVAALQARPDSKILAGGQTLLASMKLRLASPEQLIDLGRIPDLKTIKHAQESITLGAMARHADVATSADVARAIPALAHLASHIGDRMVRRMGTIGGSIANNDPAADYPAGLVALKAIVETSKRKIKAEEFFVGMFETALEPDELVVSITFPIPKRAGYVKFKHPASRFAIVGVFVAEYSDGVRVAVTGAAPSVFRVHEFEAALARKFSADAIVDVKLENRSLNSDLHASAEYRAALLSVIAGRSVETALRS